MIGKINIYDIYTPCYSNLPSNVSRARYHLNHDHVISGPINLIIVPFVRNPLKELVLSRSSQPQIYYGPDECIDDHVESKYFDNPTVCASTCIMCTTTLSS